MNCYDKLIPEALLDSDDTLWFLSDFRYLRLPKVLLEDPIYQSLSANAKLCYSILMERTILSFKNKWVIANGEYFVYCTNRNMGALLGCSENSCTRIFRELESFGLFVRKKQGQGRPTIVILYPLNEPFNLRVKTVK